MLLVCSEDQRGLKIGVQVKSRVQDEANYVPCLTCLSRDLSVGSNSANVYGVE